MSRILSVFLQSWPASRRASVKATLTADQGNLLWISHPGAALVVLSNLVLSGGLDSHLPTLRNRSRLTALLSYVHHPAKTMIALPLDEDDYPVPEGDFVRWPRGNVVVKAPGPAAELRAQHDVAVLLAGGPVFGGYRITSAWYQSLLLSSRRYLGDPI